MNALLGTTPPELQPLPAIFAHLGPALEILSDAKALAVKLKTINDAYKKAKAMVELVAPAQDIAKLRAAVDENHAAAKADKKAAGDAFTKARHEAATVRQTIIKKAGAERDDILSRARADAAKIKSDGQVEVAGFHAERDKFITFKNTTEGSLSDRETSLGKAEEKLAKERDQYAKDKSGLEDRLAGLNAALRVA